MPEITFTSNLQRHIDCPPSTVTGTTVREALDNLFANNKPLEDYVLDDQRRVRKHVVIFVNGEPIYDRDHLSDSVTDDCEIYVMQALSGG